MANEKGQTEASVVEGTTSAPKTMYKEIVQDEDVSRGYVKVFEIIAYDATKEPRRYAPEKLGVSGEIMKDRDGNILYVEVGRKPYFCQDREDTNVFEKNNPNARIEMFVVQLLKSTAIRYLDDPENMKQFKGNN